MKRIASLFIALLLTALCLTAALASEGATTWQGRAVEVTDIAESTMLAPSGMADDEFAVTVSLTVDDEVWKDKDLAGSMQQDALLRDAQGNAYEARARGTGVDDPMLVFFYCVPKGTDVESLTFTLGADEAAAQTGEIGAAAGSADEGYTFRFPNGLTWASTVEDVLASAEGEPRRSDNGGMTFVSDLGVSFAGRSFQAEYVFMDGALTMMAYGFTGDDRAAALADAKALLCEIYGEPNMSDLERLFAAIEATGGMADDAEAIEASPWAGWMLPDGHTLIFASDVNGAVAALFINEAAIPPAA